MLYFFVFDYVHGVENFFHFDSRFMSSVLRTKMTTRGTDKTVLARLPGETACELRIIPALEAGTLKFMCS